MIEIIGTISTTLAVTGVLLNNRLNRLCFIVWLVSNGMSAGIHISMGMYSLAVRDVVFFALAIEGFFRWKKRFHHRDTKAEKN